MESNSKIFPNISNLKCCSKDGCCWCGDEEIVIRNYINGNVTQPMTHEQRVWCVNEADYSGEGYYKRDELEKMSDKDLAVAVLNGWDLYSQSHY